MKAWVLAFGLSFLAACSNSTTNSSTDELNQGMSSNAEIELNLEVKKVTLENGLRVLIHRNDQLPIFSFYIFYDVGGRYEAEAQGTTGATHFLEHMMFKGAKKYGPGMFDTLIEGNGGTTNAYTNFDNTVYYENLPSKILPQIVDMESDRMENLLLAPEAFESERKVVMEERKMRYENSPAGKLYLSMMQAVFEKTPYGGSVIGSQRDLETLNRDQVMDFFKKFYRPDNAIIVIAGDIDEKETLKMVKEKFGSITSSSKEIKDYKQTMDATDRFTHRGRYPRHIKLKGNSPTPMFSLAYKGQPIGTRDSFVMDILASILGDGESSYLNQAYVKNETPKLSSVSVSNYTMRYNGVFFVQGQLLPKIGLDDLRRRLGQDLLKSCDEAVNVRNVQKTKNQYLIGYYNDLQTNAGIASFLGLRENYFGDYSFYRKELEIYNSITAEELKEVCHRLFAGGQNIFVSIWEGH